MKFARAMGLGFRRARRHPGLVALFYLATLLPALLIVSLLSGNLGRVLDGSLFADGLLEGRGFSVWIDFAASPNNRLGPIFRALPLRFLLAALVQILVAAGAVEVLLERNRNHDHPFLAGIGRHGWRFLRSAVWFVIAIAAVGGLAAAVFHFGGQWAEDLGDGRLQMWTWGTGGLLALLLFCPLDLAYDLSRISSAAHGDGRTLIGFLRAFRYALRHPLLLWPLYFSFALLIVGIHLGYIALRAGWGPATAFGVAGLVALQQLVFLLRACLQSAFWGSEIALYQGLGEPRWAGRSDQPGRYLKEGFGVRKEPATASPTPPARPVITPLTDPVIDSLLDRPGGEGTPPPAAEGRV